MLAKFKIHAALTIENHQIFETSAKNEQPEKLLKVLAAQELQY